MFGYGGVRVPAVNGTPTGTGINATTVSVYTNIDANPTFGAVAGRGAISSITWDIPGQRIKPTGPSEVFWIAAMPTSLQGEIKVDWRAPYSDGGAPITGWQYSTDNGDTWAAMDASFTYNAVTLCGSYVITKVSATGASLANGTTYQILVRAVNAAGLSGVWAGQTMAQGIGTAWPFATTRRADTGTNRALISVTTLP
jgi:hypothetical protein